MSRRDDHRIGLTPLMIRRAAYYLKLGQGDYYPCHPHFDKVVVSTSYDIRQPCSDVGGDEWSQGMLVSFYKEGRRIRWLEFGCRLVGAGGDSIVKPVD